MSRMMIPCLAAALMMHQALAVPQGDVAGERVEASDVSLTQVSSNWRWVTPVSVVKIPLLVTAAPSTCFL